jgi:undecaprenyl diphosphate synthase
MGFLGRFFEKDKRQERLLPQHIAIIMDGNGRWAKKRGLPRSAGHSAGASNFRSIARYCNKIGIKYLTVYAFSTENWKRPKNEVDSIMKLFGDYLREAISDFKTENIKTRFIGDTTVLSDDLQQLISEATQVSSKATGMTLNIAINYGGRQEIVMAAKNLCLGVAQGRLLPDAITEDAIAQHLYTAHQPDPDLIIRPSGERRISNFLLWQSAYAELWYSDVLWPDFTPQQLELAIDDFNRRGRRFGGL